MLIEHTHLHLQQIPPDRGEFQLQKVLIELGQVGTNLQFENWLRPERDVLPDENDRWEACWAGAKKALQEAGIEHALVCLVGFKFLDDSLPPPLCEQLSKTCIKRALENPEISFTESGNKRALQRFKERNSELLDAWNGNQLFNWMP